MRHQFPDTLIIDFTVMDTDFLQRPLCYGLVPKMVLLGSAGALKQSGLVGERGARSAFQSDFGTQVTPALICLLVMRPAVLLHHMLPP